MISTSWVLLVALSSRVLIGLTPRESWDVSRSFASVSLLLPARATSRMLEGRFSKLAVLRFVSDPRSAAPPMKLRLFSLCLSLSFSPKDFPLEKRFLIHPLTFDVGDMGESLPLFCSFSAMFGLASIDVVAGCSLDRGASTNSSSELELSSAATSPAGTVLAAFDFLSSSLASRFSSALAAFSSAFLALMSCFSCSAILSLAKILMCVRRTLMYL